MTPKSEILAAHERKNADWIAFASEKACGIAREKGDVPGDDLREILSALAHAAPRIFGAVFNSRLFTPSGFSCTRRRSSLGRPIRLWTLAT